MYDRQIDCLLIGGNTNNYRSAYGDICYVSNAVPNSDDAYVVFPFEGLPFLFTYEKYPDLKIPNTTNSLDGCFQVLKELTIVHRGSKQDLKDKIIQEVLWK